MEDLIFELCALGGVSGDEADIAAFCAEKLRKFGKTEIDFNNNVISTFGNNNADKTILLDAHLDQIGFIVTDIDEKGFLKVDKSGGIDYRSLPGSPVKVFGRQKLDGIICCMPPHLSDGNEDKAIEADKLYIDLGLPADIVRDKVAAGDTVAFNSKTKLLLNNRICSAALDNRAGVAALLRVCELISAKELSYRVAVLLSCQEETYGVGAKTKAFEYDPDECICVDVSFANQPGITDSYSGIELGKGPMLCYSPTLSREMTDKLKTAAKANNIPVQTEVCGGRTGTNADHISISKGGVKSAVVSVPLRNMHTQVETVDINDIEYTARLVAAYIISGGV